MSLDTLDAVMYAIAFLVPGFIISAVISMLVPRRIKATELRMVEFLTLSCINHACWIWLIWPVFRGNALNEHPWLVGLVLFLVVFISPVALGLSAGGLAAQDRIKFLLGRLGFRTIHPIPTAWDYYFSRSAPCWATVTLKDGSRIYGLFHHESFAGDDPEERDLYLQTVFKPTEQGDLAPVEDSLGILIKAERIAAIEFKRLMENPHGEV